MQNLSSFLVTQETPVIEAMAMINLNSQGIVFLCSQDGGVTASLTDGDVRRHIIGGKQLDAPSIIAANTNFHYVSTPDEYRNAQKICAEKTLVALPYLDENKRLISIFFANEVNVIEKPSLNMPVVIMAGGKGTRLYPYTKILPKPLVPIGDVTITEHIISNFEEYSCNEIIMIVNHKKNMIKAYFSDEYKKNNVKFMDEDTPLGTGGGLKLLEGLVKGTFFVTNCDVLVFADYNEILRTHKEAGNIITMVCATRAITIPYGVIEVGCDGKISSLTEKPSFPFLTNTGVYVVEPKFLSYIQENTVTPITDIIQACVDSGENVGIYPISEEQWSDMGQPDEMEKMQRKLSK